MMNFEFLLNNPELAKHIKFEITGENLLELSASIIKASREQALIDSKNVEQFLTINETCNLLKRDRSTLFRWKQKRILVPSQLGLYKKSDVVKFMSK
ncbi:MAG: helix-turn-helix domain-containing protein [Dysgonomonas sp.]